MSFNNYEVLDIGLGWQHSMFLLSPKIKRVRDSKLYEKFMLKLRNHPMKAPKIREEMIMNGVKTWHSLTSEPSSVPG